MAPDEVSQLVEDTERMVRDSSQLFPFTREICNRIAPEDRVGIIEMLWKVAYADGVLDPYEDMLLRRIGSSSMSRIATAEPRASGRSPSWRASRHKGVQLSPTTKASAFRQTARPRLTRLASSR